MAEPEKIDVRPGVLDEEPPAPATPLSEEEEARLIEEAIVGEATVKTPGGKTEDDGKNAGPEGEKPEEPGKSEGKKPPPTGDSLRNSEYGRAENRKNGRPLFTDAELRLLAKNPDALSKRDKARVKALQTRFSKWRKREERAKEKEKEAEREKEKEERQEEAQKQTEEELFRQRLEALRERLTAMTGAELFVYLDFGIGLVREKTGDERLDKLRLNYARIQVGEDAQGQPIYFSELSMLAGPMRECMLKYLEKYPNLAVWLFGGGDYPEAKLLAAVALVYGPKVMGFVQAMSDAP